MSENVIRYPRIVEPEPPVSCNWCARSLAVAGIKTGQAFAIAGAPAYLWVHADDGATECVRTLRDEVRPYSCWLSDAQIDSVSHKAWAEDDETLEATP